MTTPRPGRWRRIRALIIKETLQVARDPSSFIVAFVMPALLLFLFGFGISFDATRLKIGLVIEDPGPDTTWFLASLSNTPFFDVRQSADRRAFVDDLSAATSMASSCWPISPSAWPWRHRRHPGHHRR